ncbi:MAG: hypothetical protein VKJ06_04765 [Vampirovibrionales bacterium]|nr:hypothetical protein [Vampirovibrionales bacterium]
MNISHNKQFIKHRLKFNHQFAIKTNRLADGLKVPGANQLEVAFLFKNQSFSDERIKTNLNPVNVQKATYYYFRVKTLALIVV